MNLTEQNEKPLLENASGAFSNLKIIRYKNRFLYSKYNPLKTIVSVIQNSTFLEGSIIVICSPCLWYGIDELIQKLPSDCRIIAIQDDLQLFNIAKTYLPEHCKDKIDLFSTADLSNIDTYIRNIIQTGKYRRSIRIDFSAGVQLNAELYDKISSGIQNITASFWMNRITLVKMGRLFSKNIFQNLINISNGIQLDEICNSIDRPIIVCGAGESLDHTPKQFIEQCFVIAVDAALTSLLQRKIHVDAVVSLESQYVIQKAYIGAEEYQDNIILFADIASRPSVVRSIQNKTVWFASEYTKAEFLSNLKKNNIIHDFIQPLGSVGLAATLIAIKLRKTPNTPIFITGLDFSYSIGLTHAKATPAHNTRLFSSNRLSSIENYNAAFAPGTFYSPSKSNNKMVTSKAMKTYADSFTGTFSGTPNLYDIGQCGIPLGLPVIPSNIIETVISNNLSTNFTLDFTNKDTDAKNRIAKYYKSEKQTLLEIKDLLINGDKSCYRNKNTSIEDQLKELLMEREYLYLHFPDGYKLSTDISFLKRIRAEIDFFLKQMPQDN